jgi:hypothetical protein
MRRYTPDQGDYLALAVSNTMTLVEAAQVAQSASVILAALFALYGFDAWRREHIGKRRLELAEEVLALFYQASDAIEQMRSPFGFGGEGSSRKQMPNEDPKHKQVLDSAYVLIERYNRYSELFSTLHAARYRFMAQVGVAKAVPFDAINTIVNELIASAHEMARLATAPDWSVRTPEAEEKRHARVVRVHDVYYGTGGDDDPIAQRVRAAVAEIERTCRGIIESKGTLFSAINARLRRDG